MNAVWGGLRIYHEHFIEFVLRILRSEDVNALIRYWAPQAFEKCLESTAVFNWNKKVLDDIHSAIEQLQQLIAAKLFCFKETTGPNAELEEECISLLNSLAIAFTRGCNYHQKHGDAMRAALVENFTIIENGFNLVLQVGNLLLAHLYFYRALLTTCPSLLENAAFGRAC